MLGSDERWGCEVAGCDVHPARGGFVLRVSPKGGPFRGRCEAHLDEPNLELKEFSDGK